MEKKKFYSQTREEFMSTLRDFIAGSGVDPEFAKVVNSYLSETRFSASMDKLFNKLHRGEFTPAIGLDNANGIGFSFRLGYDKDGNLAVKTLPVNKFVRIEDALPAFLKRADEQVRERVVEMLDKYGVCGPIKSGFKDKSGAEEIKYLMWDPELHAVFQANGDKLEKLCESRKAFGQDLNDDQVASLRNNLPFELKPFGYAMFCPLYNNVMLVENKALIDAMKNCVATKQAFSLSPDGTSASVKQAEEQKPQTRSRSRAAVAEPEAEVEVKRSPLKL